MTRITAIAPLFLSFLLLAAGRATAQRLPETSQPAPKPHAKPARIIFETLPDAEVYLDDERQGQASQAGHWKQEAHGQECPCHVARTLLSALLSLHRFLQRQVGPEISGMQATGSKKSTDKSVHVTCGALWPVHLYG